MGHLPPPGWFFQRVRNRLKVGRLAVARMRSNSARATRVAGKSGAESLERYVEPKRQVEEKRDHGEIQKPREPEQQRMPTAPQIPRRAYCQREYGRNGIKKPARPNLRLIDKHQENRSAHHNERQAAVPEHRSRKSPPQVG